MTALSSGSIHYRQKLISRFTDQPGSMPAELRDRIEEAWGGEVLQLYAFSDIDASMRFNSAWLALGEQHLALVTGSADVGDESITVIDRSAIKAVRETPGLSFISLTLLGEPDEPALAVIRFTFRQKRAFETIRYLLEQRIKGQSEADADAQSLDADTVYADSVSSAVTDTQASVAHNSSAIVLRLVSYMKPYWKQVALGFAAAVLLTAAALVPPRLTGYLIDEIVRPSQQGLISVNSALEAGVIITCLLGSAYLLSNLMLWVRFRTLAFVGEFVARDLRHHLHEHLQTLSVSFYSKKQTGSLISRVTSDTDRLWDFIAFGVVELTINVLLLIGLGFMLVWMDTQLGIVVIAPIPLYLWMLVANHRRERSFFMRIWRKWSDMTRTLSDTIPGIRVVKAFNREKHEKERFDAGNDGFMESCNLIHCNWTRFWPLLMFCVQLMILSVWIFALPRLIVGSAAGEMLPLGKFVAFSLYLTMFIRPIDVIGQTTRMLNRATTSANRVFEILDTQPDIVEPRDGVRLEPMLGRVQFEDVTFAYDDIRKVIKGVSFDVKPGEMIGLVGPSGAGKTTITNLLVRFYDTSSGTIRIDGVDLKNLDIGHYRRNVGMVLQDPYLFHGTILDNIRYGNPDATFAQIVESARMANAHEFISKLPHGYETVVGERGHTLSGGERQRVSIARAVLGDPRILILDEATSSVDTETEQRIQEALNRLVNGRTVFAIAHRLSTLKRADRLFVVDDGVISEQGTHAELLDMDKGTYRKLYTLQRQLHEGIAG